MVIGSFYFMNSTLVVTAAVVHQEDKWSVADCPELGTVSQGRTFEEAVHNLQEATDLYIEEFGAPSNIPARSVITTVVLSGIQGNKNGSEALVRCHNL